ncbi:hypothetical protein ACROYT_G002065 [Oculina patagonica]
MEKPLRIKKISLVCVLLAQIGVCFSALDSALHENKNDQSMELTWRIGDFQAEQGYELADNILRTITVSDYFDCVTACLAERRCCSVNYKPDDVPICDLNIRCRRKQVEDGCMKRSPNVIYYELSETKGRTLAKDPCRSSPCSNGGTCILTARCNGYKCTCHALNTGEHCEHWIDDASDFDLMVSNRSFASFDFAQTSYSSDRAWHGFTACLWVKYVLDAGSKIALLTYFSTSGDIIFRIVYEESSNELLFYVFDFSRLVSIEAPELKDESWHHVCVMWENTAGTVSLFIDGAMRVRGQGKFIGRFVKWDGVLYLGDKRVFALSAVSLSCVRLWKGAITEAEVKMEYANKKCENHKLASMTWPLFKRAHLQGNASSWTNSSSLLEEDLDFKVSFPQDNLTDYITMESFSFPLLSYLTVCLWQRSPAGQQSKMSVVSYSITEGDGAFAMELEEESGKLVLTARIDDVNGQKSAIFKNDFWNHLCLAWSSATGDYEFYVNGTVKVIGLLKKHHTIPANGLLVIGAKRITRGIGNAFAGTVSCLQMWSNRLSLQKINALFEAKRCEPMFEPFFIWNDVKSGTPVGNVKWKMPSSITKPDTVSDEDFDAVFPERSTDGYIMVDSMPVLELTELTVSLWVKTDTCSEKHTLLIYSTSDREAEIWLRLEKTSNSPTICKLIVTLKDVELTSTSFGLSDSDWHFVAFKWESASGNYALWLDAVLSQGIGKFEGQKIARGNILIGEQEGDDQGNPKNGFTGRITCLQMWKTSLSAADITSLYNTKRLEDGACYTAKDSYSLLTWAQVITAKAIGEVTVNSPSVLKSE